MYADWMKNISLNVTLEDINEWKRRKRLKKPQEILARNR